MSVVGGSVAVMTTTVEPPDQEWVAVPPGLPVSVLAAVTDTVADLDDVLWAAKPPGVLLDTMRSLERLRSVLDGVELSVVAEIDATGAARSEGWASTKDFVTAVTGGFKGAGRRLVALAKAVTGDRSATAAALAAGRISRTQAEVVVGAVERLPATPGLRDAAEALLLDQARDHDATDLTRRGAHVLERLDPDGTERRDERARDREERSAHLGRYLSLTDDGLGGVRIKGRGTVEDAAHLKAALLPLAAPAPAAPAGSCGSAPQSRPGECGIEGCGHDGRDPREHGTRFWDALVEACRRLTGTDQLPESHGARPRVAVTIDHDSLVTGLGEGHLDTGGTLSAAAVRRLACDADLLPVVLGTHSEILDVGRTHRLVTLALWYALVVRDHGCAFPGCTRPPIACDAHHITHWADGGPTSLPNLVMLCRAHHTLIHTTPWQVRLRDHDQRPEFLPPPRRGRETAPLRRMPLRE